MDDSTPKKRKSLRDSVLKRPKNRQHSIQPYDPPNQDRHGFIPRSGLFQHDMDGDDFLPGGNFFGGFGPIFDNDKDDFPFGFGGFGNMDRFLEHFNEMMNRFSSDFEPQSFADSQFYNEDRDLDEDISRRGLDKALEPKSPQPRFHSSGFSRSEFITTRPDGTKERRITQRDSQGNVETTVTITHPDGTTETIKDGAGSHTGSDIIRDHLVSDFDDRHPMQEPKGLFQSIYDNLRRFF